MSTTTMSAATPIGAAINGNSTLQIVADAMRVDVAVGAAIRRRRQACKLTLEQLGTEIGVTYQQIQKYETGKNRVAVSTLYAMAPALGCTVTEINDDVLDILGGGFVFPEPIATPVLQLSMRLMALPEETRRAVLSSCTAVVSAVEDARRQGSGGAS